MSPRLQRYWQDFCHRLKKDRYAKINFPGISVAGWICSDNNHETKFFDAPLYSIESDDDLLAEMERFDTILLGANTYKMFVNFWPQATNDEQVAADKLNSIPKIVFSKTLKKAPWGKWPAAQIVADDAVAFIKEQKAQNGKDMVLWGSISLAQDLMKANLIDEYHFRIVPVLLGSGTLLFTKSGKHDLELTHTKSYSSGLLLAHYRPK